MRKRFFCLVCLLTIAMMLQAQDIQRHECWIDSDYSHRQTLDSGDSISVSFSIEGLASGLPAIVSDIPPFTEIIGSDNGIVSGKDNPQSLASAMCRMLELGETGRAQIAANSLRMVQESFTYEAAAAKTLKVYSSLV